MGLYIGTTKVAETLGTFAQYDQNLSVQGEIAVFGCVNATDCMEASFVTLPYLNGSVSDSGSVYLNDDDSLTYYNSPTCGRTWQSYGAKATVGDCVYGNLALKTKSGLTKYIPIIDTNCVSTMPKLEVSTPCGLGALANWNTIHEKIWSCCVDITNCANTYSQSITACIDRTVAKRGGLCAVMIPPSKSTLMCACNGNPYQFNDTIMKCIRGGSSLGTDGNIFWLNSCIRVTKCDGCTCTIWSENMNAGNANSGWRSIPFCICFTTTRYYCFPENNSSQYGHFGTMTLCQTASYGTLNGGPNNDVNGSIAASTVTPRVCSCTSSISLIQPNCACAKWTRSLSSGNGSKTICSSDLSSGFYQDTCNLCGVSAQAAHCEYATVIDNIKSNSDTCPSNCARIGFCIMGGKTYLATGTFGYRGVKCNVTCYACPIITSGSSSATYLNSYLYKIENTYGCKYHNVSHTSGGLCLCACFLYACCCGFNVPSIPARGWLNGQASTNVPCQPTNSPCWILEVWSDACYLS